MSSVEYAPDGAHVVVSGERGGSLWVDSSDAWQQQAVMQGHTSWVPWCTFSAGGGFVATASSDETVKLWDVSQWVC